MNEPPGDVATDAAPAAYTERCLDCEAALRGRFCTLAAAFATLATTT